jgi:hypothetical protein
MKSISSGSISTSYNNIKNNDNNTVENDLHPQQAIIINNDNKEEEGEELQRKIALVTEGFISKSALLILTNRNRLSKENAMTVCNYIIAMKREINPKPNYIRYTLQILSELSKFVGIAKKFTDMIESKDDVLLYLDSCRKLENDDPLHKWVGSYNTKRTVLIRFFKWLYYGCMSLIQIKGMSYPILKESQSVLWIFPN